MPADCVGPGTRFTGLAAAAAGRLDEAERLLTDALHACQAVESWPNVAGIEVELARVLVCADRPDEARVAAARCLEVCDRAGGMPFIRAKAAALLA